MCKGGALWDVRRMSSRRDTTQKTSTDTTSLKCLLTNTTSLKCLLLLKNLLLLLLKKNLLLVLLLLQKNLLLVLLLLLLQKDFGIPSTISCTISTHTLDSPRTSTGPSASTHTIIHSIWDLVDVVHGAYWLGHNENFELKK